jgi:hypothetical protein
VPNSSLSLDYEVGEAGTAAEGEHADVQCSRCVRHSTLTHLSPVHIISAGGGDEPGVLSSQFEPVWPDGESFGFSAMIDYAAVLSRPIKVGTCGWRRSEEYVGSRFAGLVDMIPDHDSRQAWPVAAQIRIIYFDDDCGIGRQTLLEVDGAVLVAVVHHGSVTTCSDVEDVVELVECKR